MSEHPIEGLMITAMNSIQDMVDVNTIIGEPIETSNNTVIIPISKVCFGFAAGGSEFKGETLDEYSKKDKDEEIQYRLPFGGGSGAGVSINPVAFLIVQPNGVKLLPVSHTSAVDKLLDYIPDAAEKLNELIDKTMNNMKENKKDNTKVKPSNASAAVPPPSRPKQRKGRARPTIEFEYDETTNENNPVINENVEYDEEYDD